MQFNVRMFLHSLGNTSRHFRAVERPLSGRGSVDQSEVTEHWRFPGLFRVMRFISSRNTNGPENQVGVSTPFSRKHRENKTCAVSKYVYHTDTKTLTKN